MNLREKFCPEMFIKSSEELRDHPRRCWVHAPFVYTHVMLSWSVCIWIRVGWWAVCSDQWTYLSVLFCFSNTETGNMDWTVIEWNQHSSACSVKSKKRQVRSFFSTWNESWSKKETSCLTGIIPFMMRWHSGCRGDLCPNESITFWNVSVPTGNRCVVQHVDWGSSEDALVPAGAAGWKSNRKSSVPNPWHRTGRGKSRNICFTQRHHTESMLSNVTTITTLSRRL